MRTTPALAAAVAGAALTLLAPSAQAAAAQTYDRSLFDGTPETTAAGWRIAGGTSGELGGYLDMTVQVQDGTLPAQGQCEPADVDAVLTVDYTETFTIHTTADLCAHIVDGSPSLFGGFSSKQVTYSGTHKRARLVGDGSVSFSQSWLGGLGNVHLAVRW